MIKKVAVAIVYVSILYMTAYAVFEAYNGYCSNYSMKLPKE